MFILHENPWLRKVVVSGWLLPSSLWLRRCCGHLTFHLPPQKASPFLSASPKAQRCLTSLLKARDSSGSFNGFLRCSEQALKIELRGKGTPPHTHTTHILLTWAPGLGAEGLVTSDLKTLWRKTG